MQLYKIIMQVKWADPDHWKSLIVRPGGMHNLMSFVGWIGTLMNGNGLEERLEAAFSGIGSMLNGKTWPKALWGLWIVVVALLWPLISAETTVYSLEEQLDTICMSRTA